MNFAVVPAAGRSSRLGRAKALLPFGPSVVLDTVVETLRGGGVDRLVVVVAPGEDRLLDHCAHARLGSTVNPRVADGMLSSIRHGLGSLSSELTESDTVTICPVDFPALRAATVTALIAGLRASPQRIAVPRFRGRRGHPLVLSADLVPEVRSLALADGLRALLDLHPHLEVEVEDPGVRHDLDTWLDYAELTASRPQ